MARADAASASLRSDSIKGLAQSIANPAYRRLLTAEPLLRRAVPVLIIAFMLTICVGAARAGARAAPPGRRSTPRKRSRRSPIISPTRSIVRARDGRIARRAHVGRAERGIARPGRRGAGRRVLVADADGAIVAAIPERAADAWAATSSTCSDPSQPLTTFGAAAGTLEIALADGEPAFATVRALKNPVGLLAVIQPRDERACALALDHRADRHAVGDHRLRRADPRLCLPLAGDPRPRGRPHPRHGARPHRYRAQSRPLRTVGLGPRARPGVLVAFDVRHARPARRRTTC